MISSTSRPGKTGRINLKRVNRYSIVNLIKLTLLFLLARIKPINRKGFAWFPRPKRDPHDIARQLVGRALSETPMTQGEWRTWYQELWRLPAQVKPEVWGPLESALDNATISDIRREFNLVAREEADLMMTWRIRKAYGRDGDPR